MHRAGKENVIKQAAESEKQLTFLNWHVTERGGGEGRSASSAGDKDKVTNAETQWDPE